MSSTSSYCKAYLLTRLQEYPGWEELEPDGKRPEPSEPREDRILYLHANFVVTDGVFVDENVVFESDDPSWSEFCREQLRFAPDESV